MLVVVVAIGLLVAKVRRAGLGRRMLAVRSNERAAAAAGIDVRNTKFAAYAISSFIAGLGGTLYAYTLGSVSAERFGILIALGFVAFAYVGGITMVSGAVFGGLIATSGLIPHVFEAELGISGTWTLLVAGVTLILNLILFPDGVAGSRYQKKKLAAAKAAGAPDPRPAARRGRDGERAMSAALTAQGVSVRFGGLQALVDVDLEVPEGALVGLIGPNGAGKTTFIDAITGFVPAGGRVQLAGTELSGLAPHERARAGLARTWQSGELFDDLTVGENLAVAAERPSVWATIREVLWKGDAEPAAVHDALALVGLEDVVGRAARRAHAGRAQAGGRGPRARRLAARRLPRRARRGARHGRERRSSGAGCAQVVDRGHGDAAGRPRHGPRAQHLRPHRRARVRAGDRERHAR